MPPSQLSIATSSLSRLLREEQSYYKELQAQQKRIDTLTSSKTPDAPGEEGNREFNLKQEKQALAETRAVLPTVRERITSAREKLESLFDSSSDTAELEKAKEVLTLAKEAQKDDPDSAKPQEVV